MAEKQEGLLKYALLKSGPTRPITVAEKLMLRILRTGAGECLQLKAQERLQFSFLEIELRMVCVCVCVCVCPCVCVCVCVIQQSRAQEHKSRCAKAEDDVGSLLGVGRRFDSQISFQFSD